MPRFIRCNWPSLITLCNCCFAGKTAKLSVLISPEGVTHLTIAIAPKANTAVNQNKPDIPTIPASHGPEINAKIKAAPIVAPMIAIIFERSSGRLRSAANAIKVLAIAPEPCNARPTISPQTVSALAAITLPIANIIKPMMITGFRPIRSDR